MSPCVLVRLTSCSWTISRTTRSGHCVCSDRWARGLAVLGPAMALRASTLSRVQASNVIKRIGGRGGDERGVGGKAKGTQLPLHGGGRIQRGVGVRAVHRGGRRGVGVVHRGKTVLQRRPVPAGPSRRHTAASVRPAAALGIEPLSAYESSPKIRGLGRRYVIAVLNPSFLPVPNSACAERACPGRRSGDSVIRNGRHVCSNVESLPPWREAEGHPVEKDRKEEDCQTRDRFSLSSPPEIGDPHRPAHVGGIEAHRHAAHVFLCVRIGRGGGRHGVGPP